jgi:outer membrane protein OmpA-like peptidoglycan-associated protein
MSTFKSFFYSSIYIIGISLIAVSSLLAQEGKMQPQWWFGGALGANFNFYSGNLQTLSTTTTTTSAFTKGSGAGLFVAPLLEFRPEGPWGGMMAVGFDSRRGSFDAVGGNNLSASINYLSVEPALRYTLSSTPLYLFAGPRLGFDVSKSYTYQPSGGTESSGDFSGIRSTVLTGQVGVGYDIPLSNPDANTQTELSPFVSFQFGEGPSSGESWSLTSLRAGIELKFGTTTELHQTEEKEIQFSLNAPKIIPNTRRVKETFPMRNYVFFDQGSSGIPARYVKLSAEEAKDFSEERLLQPKPEDLTGRSSRQLTVYHNLLNIFGDRLRKHKDATITLIGASMQGADDGRALAESVKQYLVNTFGIEAFRINTEGRTKPEHPSEKPGDTRELDLVRAEDRRVDITSSSEDVLQPVQIISLQEEPLDSDVLFTVAGAQDMLSSWSLEVTGDSGDVKKFGPFTSDQERISGKELLGKRMAGKYTVSMTAETKGGQLVKKEETMRLARSVSPEDSLGSRFSILFEFDESKTVATYADFLRNTVAPLIPDGGSVVIHGHTDIVGEESHNLKLSQDRAQETMKVLEEALTKSGKHNVKFDTYGFGADVRRAPFENRLPEERFYNRTVIIDIVPEQ